MAEGVSSILPGAYRTEVAPSYTLASSTNAPAPEVIEAMEAGVVRITRRVAVFEKDGSTPWNPDEVNDPNFKRLIDGSVKVDYSADERRKLDLTLDNIDKKLRCQVGGLWYDKVIKVYRGVTYQGKFVTPRVAIVEAPSTSAANQLITALSSIGLTRTEYLPAASTVGDLTNYSIVVSLAGATPITKTNLLTSVANAGKSVMTFGVNNTFEVPLYTNFSNAASAVQWGVSPINQDSPVKGQFTAEAAGSPTTGQRPIGLALGTQPLSSWTNGADPMFYTGATAPYSNGGSWTDFHLPVITGTQTRALIRAMVNYLRNYSSNLAWETQLGVFMVDQIDDEEFPDSIKITARDYTKKLILSKFSKITTFEKGELVSDIIRDVASNAGVTTVDQRISMAGEVLASDMSFDRGTERWTVIKSFCDSFGYEIFFDAFGKLVVRKYLDPSTSPVAWTFKTGTDGGNLISLSKSINDSNLFNVVAVYSDPGEGEDRLPYFAEARNTDPNSPTSIEAIGERVMPPLIYNTIASDADCLTLAKSELSRAALESYSINFASIYYPWLEVGEIVRILDPDALDFEPTRYLMDSLDYPLALGPMTAVGRRVTLVGNNGGEQ